MMRMRFFGSAAIALAFALALVSESHAQVQIRSWPSSGYFDVHQLDNACAVSGEFEFDGRPDVRFSLFFGGDDVQIAFSSLGWSDIDDEIFDADFFFFDVTSFSGPAVGITFDHIYHGFVAKFGPDVLEAFAKADSLLVAKGEATVTHINLLGSGVATSTLKRCVAHVQSELAAQASRENRWDYIAKDPFAEQPTTPGDSSAQSPE